jgi:hypothetical protein
MTQSEIETLENVLKRYKNNLDFAIRTNSKQRESHYRSLINTTENQLKELGKVLPLESNKYLRDELKNRDDRLTQQDEIIKNLRTELKEQNIRIDKLANPEKYKEPEPILEQDHICPACGRSFKGAKGMAAHQRSGACKAAK